MCTSIIIVDWNYLKFPVLCALEPRKVCGSILIRIHGYSERYMPLAVAIREVVLSTRLVIQTNHKTPRSIIDRVRHDLNNIELVVANSCPSL